MVMMVIVVHQVTVDLDAVSDPTTTHQYLGKREGRVGGGRVDFDTVSDPTTTHQHLI